jgi:hypothetical protein
LSQECQQFVRCLLQGPLAWTGAPMFASDALRILNFPFCPCSRLRVPHISLVFRERWDTANLNRSTLGNETKALGGQRVETYEDEVRGTHEGRQSVMVGPLRRIGRLRRNSHTFGAKDP